MPLYDILNEFQKGHSHMAAVVKQSDVEQPPFGNLSVGKSISFSLHAMPFISVLLDLSILGFEMLLKTFINLKFSERCEGGN